MDLKILHRVSADGAHTAVTLPCLLEVQWSCGSSIGMQATVMLNEKNHASILLFAEIIPLFRRKYSSLFSYPT